MDAFALLSRTEGIIPAIESAHAVAGAVELGRELGPDAVILVNLSGRGDKDVDTAAKWFGMIGEGQSAEDADGTAIAQGAPVSDAASRSTVVRRSRGADRRDPAVSADPWPTCSPGAPREGRGALVGYLPAGYPTVDGSVELFTAAIEGGCDLVEVGIPYSDPVMDGPTIQAAADTALRAGFRVRDVFTVVERISAAGGAAVVMTYFNPVLRYGVDAFARDLAAAGGLGVITPDLIPDEADEWLAASTAHGLDRIFLVAPSSTEERIASTAAASSGFLYATSTMGVTGARGTVDTAAATIVARCRPHTALPIGVGLGVRSGEQAAEVAAFADAVIVGSALVAAAERGGPTAVRDWPPSWPPACAGPGYRSPLTDRPRLGVTHQPCSCTARWAHTPRPAGATVARVCDAADPRGEPRSAPRGMIGVWPPPPRALPACAPPRTRASWTRCAAGTGSGC